MFREAKYLHILGYELSPVPAPLDVLRRMRGADADCAAGHRVPVRVHVRCAALSQRGGCAQEMITEMYNQILELGDVSELSLVQPSAAAETRVCGGQERIEELNLQLAEGEEVLTWKSHGIDHFIVASLQMVESMYSIITGLQANVQRIRVVLDAWAEKPLFYRNNQKTYTPEQFQVPPALPARHPSRRGDGRGGSRRCTSGTCRS
eukprot:2378660-Rhodomonas_salina.1